MMHTHVRWMGALAQLVLVLLFALDLTGCDMQNDDVRVARTSLRTGAVPRARSVARTTEEVPRVPGASRFVAPPTVRAYVPRPAPPPPSSTDLLAELAAFSPGVAVLATAVSRPTPTTASADGMPTASLAVFSVDEVLRGPAITRVRVLQETHAGHEPSDGYLHAVPGQRYVLLLHRSVSDATAWILAGSPNERRFAWLFQTTTADAFRSPRTGAVVELSELRSLFR